jgi:capsid portal protein
MFIYLDRVAEWRRAIVEAVAEGKEADEIKVIQDNIPTTPTEAEIEDAVASWQQRAEMEHSLLAVRLETLCYEYPLQELFKRTEINRGGLGFCAWEILRDAAESPIRAKLIEPLWIRATELDEQTIPVPWLRKTSDVTFETVHVERRFRRYLMKRNESEVWFKEFGDPRVISSRTGKVYADLDALRAAITKHEEKQGTKPATELILWAEYSPGAEPYGLPIWHGHSLDVETARASKEYDYDELAHGKMPRGVFSVIDATMDGTILDRLQKFLREGGIGNRNRVALLEMATASMSKIAGAGRAIFDFTDFSKAQKDDATHLKLKEGADDGVGQDFGNPAVLMGNSKAVQNRSVAEVSQQVAEEQTYTSLRKLWAHAVNQHLVRPWGFRFWRFKLKAPRLQQAEVVSKLLKVLIEEHVITPDQARPVAATLLGIEILGEPADYQRVPPKMAQAGMTAQILKPTDDPMTVEDESDDMGAEAGGEKEGEAARGLMQQLGIMATGFSDGPAAKMRARLKIERERADYGEGDMIAPVPFTVDD